MTLQWTHIAVIAAAAASIQMTTSPAMAQASGLRGTLETAPMAMAQLGDNELFGGPLPELMPDPMYEQLDHADVFAEHPSQPEPYSRAATTYMSATDVRYHEPAPEMHAPVLARPDGLLTWQGRTQ